jgi:hypothetical protein
MVWGYFTYDKKGPIHIWKPDTAQQKRKADTEIEALNQQLEPICKEAWEINTKKERLQLRVKPGRKPTWRWNAKNGKYVRNAKKGGIDWWRY